MFDVPKHYKHRYFSTYLRAKKRKKTFLKVTSGAK